MNKDEGVTSSSGRGSTVGGGPPPRRRLQPSEKQLKQEASASSRQKCFSNSSQTIMAGRYDLEETLGKGHFATVKAAKHLFSGERVAVKVIDKTKMDSVNQKALLKEVLCMKLVQHPNVVKLYEVIDTTSKMYLVLELGQGDLYDLILRQQGGLPEPEARVYFSQILTAVSYCHKMHVAHRDLKPQNLVFFPPKPQKPPVPSHSKLGQVKLTDFGFANKFCPGVNLNTSCGSLAYSAPEILLGDSYSGPSVDIWSLGVILYMLACGRVPFEEANASETLTMIMDVKYSIPDNLSDSLKDLIRRMLVTDPARRAMLEEVEHHEWVGEGECGNDWVSAPASLPLITSTALSEHEKERIYSEMVKRGVVTSVEEVKSSLQINAYNHVTSTFYLLAERLLREKTSRIRTPTAEQSTTPTSPTSKPTSHPPTPTPDAGIVDNEDEGTRKRSKGETDILAGLIKSTRFEEILIPTLIKMASNPPSANNGTPAADPDRTTENAAPNSNTSILQSDITAQQPSASGMFALSPFAKEFVPSTLQAGPSTVNSQQRDTVDLAYAMSQVQVRGQNDSSQGLTEGPDGFDWVLSTVSDMISQVSQDPASLNWSAKLTIEVLKKHLHNDDMLGIVLALLVEQMISNTNFCYSGAKILELLRENGIGVGENSVKHLVVRRMQEEFTKALNNLDDEHVRERSLGVLRLLSELYMNFAVLPDYSKLHIFALAVLELMEKLVQKDKSVNTVKCVCQILKMIGWEVENSKNGKVREYFGLVLKELSNMKVASEGSLHPTCDALVDMVLKLHSNKWNRGQEETSVPSSTSASYAASTASGSSVYYELPDSDDDSFGDDMGIMIDDEPEEVQAAYEEFLRMSFK